MADISIHIVETGELLPVTGIELDQVYNTELITQMLHLLPNIESNKTYKMVGADNKIISSRDTLVNLGISDGDTVSVIAIDNICAVNDTLEDAHLIVRITNSGELIPVYDVDFERDTTDVLIQEIKESLNYNVHLVFDKDGAPVTIPMTFAEMGYSYGDIINVHIGNNFLFSGNERLNISNEDNIKLANLTLIIGQYRIPVDDIELDKETNDDLIFELVANGIVPEVPGKVYKVVGKNNQLVEERATLAELGFTAGDTVSVIAVDNICAVNDTLEDAHLIVHILNSGERIPCYGVDFERDTNDDLIFQLVANGIVSEVLGKMYKVVGKNNQLVEERATLAELGFTAGDTMMVCIPPVA